MPVFCAGFFGLEGVKVGSGRLPARSTLGLGKIILGVERLCENVCKGTYVFGCECVSKQC